MTPRTPGPAWVGIGAQRSGTTWFTTLLTQHPRVELGSNGRKEQHFFDTAVVDGWTDDAASRYCALFAAEPGLMRGEFTPAYLRLPHVPALLRSVCDDPPLLLVLLRDPVDRFHSAMRWYARQRDDHPGRRPTARTHRQFTEQAVWAGMYAAHLEVWAEVFGPDRLVVLQYEVVREDPAAGVGTVLHRLGLQPVELQGVGRASATSTDRPDRTPLPGLDEALKRVYGPEVDRVAERWGIDRSRWAHFA